ncbi:MAG: hypothetical protein C4530_00335 [Desulfobacteraceae bacterium]|nr:MAG: hypothetical protein C4530_00335 [Desulfobacteraceae bacterium]
MTKVRIGEYYARWCDKLTVFGGIPSSILLEESTSELDFISYVDDLFKAVAPGRRIIFGIADSTPPGAVFSRLVQLGERIAEECLLPIRAGGFRPVPLPEEKKENRAPAAAFQVPEEFVRVQQDVTAGDHIRIVKHIADLLETGADADDILNQAMLPSMEAIGERFKAGEVFIPEVLLSARAMNEATRLLEPHLSKGKRQVKGKILIGTVFGDLHDIGKNIVIIMLRGMGFEVEDAGINVPVKNFVNHVEDFRPDIVGLSALLTTTMPQMKKVIEALRENGLRQRVKVIVGGAPVNAKFAKDIGADGYAADAGEAANLAKRLMSD